MSLRRRWPVAVTIAVLAIAIGSVLGSVRIGSAATNAAPGNQSPPTISGTAQVGSTLTADNGTWSGTTPITYAYQWRRCGDDGGSCASISGASNSTYVLKGVDSGNTLRVRVTAKNSSGSSSSTSVPTAVVKAAPAAPPTVVNGCPVGTGAIDVAALAPPARLLIDGQQVAPPSISRSTGDITTRFHVSAGSGRNVTGALVYATAVPFNQFSIPSEQPTGSDGWVSLTMHQEGAFPASPRQQILAMFVRARKPGEAALGGISSRRLVSFPVRLHG
jgi:hypothetical protein